MFVRYGQAAMMAAIMTLAGNAAWAQEAKPQSCPATGCVNYYTPVLTCCKDGKCCKDGQCCNKSKKCDEKCTCGKDNKCECCKGDECGCDKCGCKKATCGCCPIMHKMAKRIGIIMIMPASMPLPGACCMEAMGMLPHPPLPPPHVLVPPPMPPPVPFPRVVVNERNCDPNTYYMSSITPARPATAAMPYQLCNIATPPTTPTICITAAPSSEQLEMSVGEGTCVHCKKMTITVGESEITVSRCVDRVRIRGEALYATAASVCTDGKDRLILDGDAVLHLEKDGNHSKIVAGHIELNLSNNAMTIQRGAKTTPSAPDGTSPVKYHW